MLELQERTEEAIMSFVPHIAKLNLEGVQRALADCTGLRALANNALRDNPPPLLVIGRLATKNGTPRRLWTLLGFEFVMIP